MVRGVVLRGVVLRGVVLQVLLTREELLEELPQRCADEAIGLFVRAAVPRELKNRHFLRKRCTAVEPISPRARKDAAASLRRRVLLELEI